MSCLGRCTLRKNRSTYWIEGWVAPRADLEDLEKRLDIWPLPRCNLRTVHPLTDSYTDYAGLAPVGGQYIDVILFSAYSCNVKVLSNAIIEDFCPLVREISCNLLKPKTYFMYHQL